MPKMIRFIIAFSISLSTITLFPGLLLAQNTSSGDIRGTVTDASGAVVPGVLVTVVDVDKNGSHTYETNADGLYDTGSIVPDHYTITFTKDGFTTFTRGPITLQVGISNVNAQLKVGAATQRVVVNTDIPLLKTETGEQSTTMTAKTMAELPQVGEAWENFVILMPGASGTPQNGSNTVNPGTESSINGNLPFSNVLADGANVTLGQSQNASFENFETVAEVKIDTSSFSAQSSMGGVVYNQITKSGTSQFHGAAYEYFQNNALNAAPYQFGSNGPTPVLRQNNFGGAIGGPILRRKMFFYFNFEEDRNFGGAPTVFKTVPTALMLSGDFTGQPTIYDPTTQTVDAAGVVHRTSFADEYHNGNKIPTAMLDPVAQAIQAFYPQPNFPGTVTNGITTNNFEYNVPSNTDDRIFFGRLDYDITPHSRLMVSALDHNSNNPHLGEGTCPIDCAAKNSESGNSQVSDVWTISSKTFNEARMGFNFFLEFYAPYTLNQGYPAKLGWQFAKANLYPTINISGACCYTQQPGTSAIYKDMNYNPSDVVTMIRGKHILHFGGELLATQTNTTPWGYVNAGTLGYTGVYTASTQGTGNTTGVPYADFLLGQTNSWSAGVTPEYGARIKNTAAFFQDDIRVLPNLTVNVGLRWQGTSGISEVKNKEQVFDPTVLNPASNSDGAMWSATTHANGRTRLLAPVWSTFLPRVAFSYQPKSNTVIRGGFGLFASNYSLDTYGLGVGNNSGFKGSENDSTNGVNPVVILREDGNTNNQGSAGASINSLYIGPTTDPSAFNGQSVNYNQYHSPVPKIWQYNLEIQRELGTNMMATVAYVGSLGFDLPFPTDINQVPEDKLSPDDATGSTNARPFPQYQSITGNGMTYARSNYNSLQASIQRRYTSGLEFNFNYTWSHFLDTQDSAGWNSYQGNQPLQNSFVPSANYGPSNFDIRNMLKGSVVYNFPIGKGRRFLNNNYVLDQLIGGWVTAATVQVQSGNPFTVVMANNNSFSQANDQYPNVVGDPLAGPHHTNQEWFNVAAFAQPAPATFGDSHRNSVYGPGLSNINFSLGKTFPIWRQVMVEIRANATNVLNHPSFAQPDNLIGPGHTAQITGVTVGGRVMQLNGRISF